MNLFDHIPQLSLAEAQQLAESQFGLSVTACQTLASERDQNFLVTTADGNRQVLKIANGQEHPAFLDGQNAMLEHLAEHIEFTPKIACDSKGRKVCSFTAEQTTHLVRMVDFLPGDTLADYGYLTDELLTDLGRRMGQLNHALRDFDHPALHREFHWDLAQAETVITSRIHLIEDLELRAGIEKLLSNFCAHTKPLLDQLPRSVIHNDANDGNIIVQPADDRWVTQVTGLVDFGDAVFSWTIGDLAVATAYAMLKTRQPISCLQTIAAGYHAIHPLQEAEISALYGLTCMRLCMSAAIAAEQTQACPGNQYLNISQQAIRETLPKLTQQAFPFAAAALHQTLHGHAVHNDKQVLDWVDRHQSQFAFPVNPAETGLPPALEDTIVLDLSVSSALLPPDLDALLEPEFTQLINDHVHAMGASLAIGRYAEPRVLYSSEHFTGGDLAEENRTIHLGIDIFAATGTAVVAPLAGVLHYAGVIDKPLDYGGLLILRHATDDGVPFFSLYGHLDPRSFKHLKQDQSIARGETIAELGSPRVNGGWPPHLHFQFMLDLLGLEHEFPGVGAASQMETWLSVSPDPNRILGLDKNLFPVPNRSKQQTLKQRKQSIGPSLSLAYRQPLKLVRGWKQHLFDETGRKFLDAYNNVPHVGHCHPRVVEATLQQMRLLNTNTRYLHDSIQDLAARVTATLPEDLQVCYFVNSASEANELAIRLARQFTQAKDMVVLDAAYHGHSTTLIELSPYKHDGPGGQGPPDWVHTVELPDLYRGTFQNPLDAGRKYADTVKKKVATIERPLSGFICESCPSVGGQILLPENYLAEVYQIIRAAGGLCIADDVQTGYGRLGSHMYGFEMQGVRPDIVILGKPMGNGHPLAAVVTTQAIAAAFNNGMEFFSTFGGNPVSCSAGLAVLDVLQEESLQANALEVGAHLIRGLRELQTEFDVIGDVRGRGFFLGVELVKDQMLKTPHPHAASFISNMCRERGILLGTDGPKHNVLKVRPPMCFSNANADELLTQLRRAFQSL